MNSSPKFLLQTGSEVDSDSVILWKITEKKTILYRVTKFDIEGCKFQYYVIASARGNIYDPDIGPHTKGFTAWGSIATSTLPNTYLLTTTTHDWLIPKEILQQGLEATRLYLALTYNLDTTDWNWDDELFP